MLPILPKNDEVVKTEVAIWNIGKISNDVHLV